MLPVSLPRPETCSQLPDFQPETWMFPERVGYDVMTDAMTEEETNKHPFVTLTPDEVSAVVESCAGG